MRSHNVFVAFRIEFIAWSDGGYLPPVRVTARSAYESDPPCQADFQGVAVRLKTKQGKDVKTVPGLAIHCCITDAKSKDVILETQPARTPFNGIDYGFLYEPLYCLLLFGSS